MKKAENLKLILNAEPDTNIVVDWRTKCNPPRKQDTYTWLITVCDEDEGVSIAAINGVEIVGWAGSYVEEHSVWQEGYDLRRVGEIDDVPMMINPTQEMPYADAVFYLTTIYHANRDLIAS